MIESAEVPQAGEDHRLRRPSACSSGARGATKTPRRPRHQRFSKLSVPI